MNSFYTIKKNSTIEYTINRSIFVGRAFAVEHVEQANEHLKHIKQLEKGATHNVYAYNFLQPAVSKYSDDGEPHGTSGPPMLNLLVKQNIYNVLLVTTRYFGGIKLGTGGLVKAYTTAATMALESAEIAIAEHAFELEFSYDYKYDSKIKYLITKFKVNNCEFIFTENVNCCLYILAEDYSEFSSAVCDILLNNNKLNIKNNSFKIFN